MNICGMSSLFGLVNTTLPTVLKKTTYANPDQTRKNTETDPHNYVVPSHYWKLEMFKDSNESYKSMFLFVCFHLLFQLTINFHTPKWQVT